jgi:hypothetical protein
VTVILEQGRSLFHCCDNYQSDCCDEIQESKDFHRAHVIALPSYREDRSPLHPTAGFPVGVIIL